MKKVVWRVVFRGSFVEFRYEESARAFGSIVKGAVYSV